MLGTTQQNVSKSGTRALDPGYSGDMLRPDAVFEGRPLWIKEKAEEYAESKLREENVVMKKFDELNARNSTIVDWNGKELRTTQDPYVSDDGSEYKAHAVDAEGNEYMITWEVVDAEATDESCACDWDNPREVAKI